MQESVHETVINEPYVPYRSPLPTHSGGQPRPYGQKRPNTLAPHRGVSVLVLSLMGLSVCLVCGMFSLVMSANDLKQMARGNMDDSGYGMTLAAFWISVFQLVLVLGMLALFMVMAVGG